MSAATVITCSLSSSVTDVRLPTGRSLREVLRWLPAAALSVALLLVCGLFSVAGRSTAVASAATFAYDAPALARADAHASVPSEDGQGPRVELRADSAPPHVEARGTSTTPFARSNATEAVSTPYGPAAQGTDAASVAARSQVEGGTTLYRRGTLGKSAASEGQFWSLEHPSTPGYASRYGLPAENVANADFIESATLRPGSPFITRAAPGIGQNVGGGIEAVVQPGGVTMCGFSYLGAKAC